MPQKPFAFLIIFLLFQLLPAKSLATIGIAETSWVFHYSSTELVEWNHGDICTAEEPSNEFSNSSGKLGKNCFRTLLLPYGSHAGPLESIIPLFFGFGDLFVKWEFTAENPRQLYLCTAYPLFIIVLFFYCLYFIARRVKRGKRFNLRSDFPLLFMAGIGILFTLPQLFSALPSLFPVSPIGKTYPLFLGLFINILTVGSPLTLGFAMHKLPLGGNSTPATLLSKTLVWGIILLSGFFAPFLLWGPPSMLYLFFPPLALANICFSLAIAFFLKGLMRFVRSLRFLGSD